VRGGAAGLREAQGAPAYLAFELTEGAGVPGAAQLGATCPTLLQQLVTARDPHTRVYVTSYQASLVLVSSHLLLLACGPGSGLLTAHRESTILVSRPLPVAS
jgi:hypothetical protein